jgi:hypothetical protein
VIPIPKIEINLKLDGEDAMRVIRAIVGTQPKQMPAKKSKETSKAISKEKVKKTEKKKRGRPLGSKNKVEMSKGTKQLTLNGKKVLPQHLALYRLWKSADEYTAQQAAEKAMCTKNVAYTFGYRHDVKWAKARRTK